jgi:hypothetical protein
MGNEKIYDGKIPFQKKDGITHLLHFEGSPHWYDIEVTFVDNYIFEDTLHYINYYTGRSAIIFEFESKEGNIYTMFLTHFNDLLKNKKPVWEITGRWTFTKCGVNYGIRYLDL